MNILEYYLKNGGGVIAGPQGLGILVGNDPSKTPPGWIFVDISQPPQNTKEILAQLRQARANWPEKETAR